MSVDTNLQGKNLSLYERVEHSGVAVLLPQSLVRRVAAVTIDVKRSVFGRRFVVEAMHAHGPG